MTPSGDFSPRGSEGHPRQAERRASVRLPIAAVLVLFCVGVSPAQEFRIGDWRAYALVGPAGLDAETQYVSFSGDQGLAAFLPDEQDLARYTKAEASLLSRFQLKVVNLEGPFPGLSGNPLDRRIDEALLYNLTTAGYDLAGLANNHGLDLGAAGLRYTFKKLADAGLQPIGQRQAPVFQWQAGSMRIDICAIADYIEQPDPDDLILILDDDGLALARKQMEGAAFRIAFAHIGSASRFVSPHERAQVKRLLDAGFDLVVCTGSHFIKGFLFEQRRPVAYGLGDHLTSLIYSRRDAEPLGMHLVAGFGRNRLMQIFLVPFHNDIRAGRLGPLDETAFRHFVRVLQERSNSAEAKYYEDEGMLEVVTESLKSLRPSQLTRLRPRHFLYAARVVVQQRPEWVAAAGVLLAAVAAAAVFRRRSRRLRKENPGA